MYSSSNMLRARKKDASFKPNRVLDKKSSRGMLYENEELRLRTIHINDEVEKGHHDLKKLKKENDHLKREIWYLRDEYEKMEQKLNKVIANQDNAGIGDAGGGGGGAMAGYVFDENCSYVLSETEDGSPPEYGDNNNFTQVYTNYTNGKQYVRKCSGATTTGTGSGTSMYDSEDEEMGYMMMIDEDGNSIDSSLLGMQMQQHQQLPSTSMAMASQEEEICQIIETEVESHNPPASSSRGGESSSLQADLQPSPPHHHHFWHHLTSIPPDLEVVTEESEHTNSNSANNNSPLPPFANSGSVSPNMIPFDETQNESFNLINLEHELNSERQQQLQSPTAYSNPIIEITPATSSNSNSNQTTSSSDASSDASSATCIASSSFNERDNIEKELEETSGDNAKTNQEDQNIQNLGCFTSIPQKFHASSDIKISGEIETTTNDDTNNSSLNQINNINNNDDEIKSSTKSKNPRRRNSRKFSRRNSIIGSQQSLSFPNSKCSSIIQQQRQQTLFPLFYQSEPSLNNSLSSFFPSYHQNSSYVGGGSSRMQLYSSYSNHHPGLIPNYNSSSLGWSCGGVGGDKNVIIGYIESSSSSSNESSNTNNNNNYGELKDLGVKEIIDQLETQFDPTLENITSVRVMSSNGLTRIFIILKNPVALKLLLEKGLTLSSRSRSSCSNMRSGSEGEEVKIPIRLIDATTESSTLILSGLPPDTLLDSTIISFLNQYGQVIGPFERRLYKGIDISECQIQIHLVKNIPSTLVINGYEIHVIVCQTQESKLGDIVCEPMNLIPMTRPPIVMLHTSPDIENNTYSHKTPYTNTNINSKSKESPEQNPPVHQPLSRATNSSCQVDYAKSQIPTVSCPAGGQSSSSRFLRQTSPSPSIQAVSQNTTPVQTPILQPKGGHIVVRRSVSSAPRLESNGLNPNLGNTMSLPPPQTMGRKMSVCHGVLEEDVITHLQNSSQRNINANIPQQQQQQQPTNIKKPLTRLPVSSPGNLNPPGDSQLQLQQQQLYISGTLTNKPFYRSMSIDPRRGSNSSRHQQIMHGMGRVSVVSDFPDSDATSPGGENRRIIQNQLSNLSQLERNGKTKVATTTSQSDSQKSLPWCGCWGNGCL